MFARLSIAGAAFILSAGMSRAEETKGGMPQLDPQSYASQLFWLAVFFILIFVFLRFVGLPRIMAILDERARRVDGDIAAADRLRASAAEAEKAYAATMASAHGDARKMVAETHAANMATLVERTRGAAADFERKVNEATAGIEAARAQALNSLREMARDLAGEITRKLIDQSPSPESVARAVDQAAGPEAVR